MSKDQSSLTGQPADLADGREVEDQYRELLDQVADLIQVIAPDGSLRYANLAWRETLGYAAEDIPHLSLMEILHPDSRAHGREMFQLLPDCPQPVRVETTLLAKDGRAVAVEGQSSCRFRDGQPIATFSALHDVTKRKRAEAALVASEEKYHLFVESLPDIVWSSDERGELVFISSNVKQIFGYTPQEMYSSGDALWFGRMHPEDVERARQAYRNLFERGEKFDVAYRIRRQDGEWIWLYDRAISIYEEGGKTYTTGISTDITERKRIEAELLATTTLQHVILESANYSIISTDPRGIIRTFNPTAERWLGYTVAEVIGRETPTLFHDREEMERYAAELSEALGRPVEPSERILANRPDPWQLDEREWTYVRKDGSRFPVRLSITSLKDMSGQLTGYLGIGSDITELKRAEAALRRQTLTDDLTGLKNRRGFITLAEQELKVARAPRRQEPLLLLYADMDDLKRINDRFGHHVGSQALVEIARVIQHTCRETDIIGRIGGDEFAILVAHHVADSDALLAERLQENLRHFNEQNGHPYQLSLSLGTTRIEAGNSASIEELLTQADEAMYEHKRSKKQ